MAHKAGFLTVTSHRVVKQLTPNCADLAVALNTKSKTGAQIAERVANTI